MIRSLALAAVVTLSLMQAGCTNEPGEQQILVDRATLTVQEMMNPTVSQDPRTILQRAKAVMICPRIFKAGFFFGGEGGRCVLLSRAGNGTWSYPAFYTIGSGSFGLQFGIEDNQLMMMILTERGLSAVLDNQFKLGANASIAVATFGAGVQGATTAAVGADIVAFAASRGLFGGIALEGSVMSTLTDWNQAYYGQAYAARQIVMQMQGGNPGADPLRDLLTRYGSRPGSTGRTPTQQPTGYAPPYPPYQPQARQPQPAQLQGGQPQGGPSQGQPYQLQPASPVPQGQGYSPPPGPINQGPIQQQTLPAPR